MSTDLYVIVSVVEVLLLVVVLAVALIRVRDRLNAIASGVATLGSVLGGVEKDLQLIGVAVPKINEPLSGIVGALPGIAAKAETVARR
ncbi:MAG: hypothetical protein ACR2NB_09460 [Solirubrobacteraceae bacterium]